MIYDPMCLEGEERTTFLERWRQICQCEWSQLSQEEKDGIYEHVRSSDFSEPTSRLKALGEQGGFSRVELFFEDPCRLHQLVCFYPSKS